MHDFEKIVHFSYSIVQMPFRTVNLLGINDHSHLYCKQFYGEDLLKVAFEGKGAMDQHGEIILYQTEDGLTKIDVRFEDETVWLTQQQLCDLYQTSKSNISEHIKHIFAEGELSEDSVIRKFRKLPQTGKNIMCPIIT